MKMESKNYLYPFFWQHGESSEVISAYMDKIYESGMKAVCIEARPHPDFVGDGWWKNLALIIDKAHEHDMKVWILDDSHFPTGYANGKIKSDYPEYKKLYLYVRRFDVTGPMDGARINASVLMGRPWSKPGLGDKKIVGVYMGQRSSMETKPGDPVDPATLRECPGAFYDDLITVDIPSGSWSIFVVFTTHEGGEEATKDYLNPLVKEATQVLVDEVYQPHYDHFASEFGKTITAFFSDEPRFGNVKGPNAVIGTDMVLPWRPGLEDEIPFEKRFLPLLWYGGNGKEREIRFQYMNLVTRLYSENFTGVLAGWCHAHNVQYVAHNIEDEGAHCRLGYGPGHYFRAQKDQDYAGVDVIGTQIVPGMPYHHDAFSTGGNNGEFYHYTLGKLAGSAAHLDPKKGGRAMCEAFGAYGWNEGLSTMKWITDHLISRGITTIVPHAFNPKEFPDWDCPPHFYAHGNNPQFRFFPQFTAYTNRLLTLFNGGRSTVRVGILYHGMSEWCGKCMPVDKVLRVLTQNQIDADIISEDYLNDMELQDGCYVINGQRFDTLIIPEAEAIPGSVERKLHQLAKSGVRIIWVNERPSEIVLSELTEDERHYLTEKSEIQSLENLAAELRSDAELTLSDKAPWLVYYHYKKEGKEIIFFFNESVTDTVDVKASADFLKGKKTVRYDAFTDREYSVNMEKNSFRLVLAPYESMVILAEEDPENKENPEGGSNLTEQVMNAKDAGVIEGKWKISFAGSKDYPDFQEVLSGESHPSFLHMVKGYEKSCGTVRYETNWKFEKTNSRKVLLDLGRVYELAEVWINKEKVGTRICPPYLFDITDALRDGENSIRIEMTNSLGNQIRDGLSQYLVIEPFGMNHEPRLLQE